MRCAILTEKPTQPRHLSWLRASMLLQQCVCVEGGRRFTRILILHCWVLHLQQHGVVARLFLAPMGGPGWQRQRSTSQELSMC